NLSTPAGGQAQGPGACFIDFDADGRPDLLLPGRTTQLYRNTGGGRFSDVSARVGLDAAGQSQGCTVGDYDNDGRSDIVLGLQNGVALYHSEANGRFSNGTAASGIQFDGAPLGLTFVDFDHDGDIDLYVSRFMPPGPNALWRNNGNATF